MRLNLALIIILLASTIAEAKIVRPCQLYTSVYEKQIKSKILSGIPFELMAVLLDSEKVLAKKVAHFSFDLWDEIVTSKVQDKLFRKFSLEGGVQGVCESLQLDLNEPLIINKTYKLKVLLNPMWHERIARLHLNNAETESNKILGIDWKRLAQELPSEKILLEKEWIFKE